tara:strand:- start:633 stop:1082 length:450 start_codon:yes stop_codon:yes gene_type:complete
MKAININGNIKIVAKPKSLGGNLGLQYASNSDLEALGFFELEQTSKKQSQDYGDIVFDSDNNKFVYNIENKTFTETVAELKTKQITELKRIYNTKLSSTDWYIVRAAEGGTAIPSNITTERNNLRIECTSKEAEINALTTKSSIVDFEI